MPLQPKPVIANLDNCEHGGLNYAELEKFGILPDEVIDFSVSSNPFGPPPGVKQVNKRADIARYPDSQTTNLRRLLAQELGVALGNILIGSGSTELIRLAILAYLNKGNNALIIEPTYGEYEVACRIVGASIIKQRLLENNGFQLDIAKTEELIKNRQPRVIFVCNPNNPTGNYISLREFGRILDIAPNSLVILDEAYVAFVDGAWPSLKLIEKGNLLILRSMTKDYSLAGLRLGYAIAREDIINPLRRICPPWNVNVVAQQAAMIVLQDQDYLEGSRAKVTTNKDYLVKELTRMGFCCLPSQANYFLVKVGNATEFRQRLLKNKILVRDCTSFGLSQYIRIAPRTLNKCRKLVVAIKKMVDGEKHDG